MSESSRQRSDDFLKISGQFKLGALVTESSHPVTANLSEVAKQDIPAALKLLFEVDDDVLKTFRAFVKSGRAEKIKDVVLRALQSGGRIFFTGCGSTGRLSILLDSVWRDFWQRRTETRAPLSPSLSPSDGERVAEGRERGSDLENRTFSVMAGGDFALIKSVEGFEDFTEFGKKQIRGLGVSAKDVVFAITEGGETSFVIGTAWAGVEAGAKVYFVYNNPDDILCEHVQRSREVIQDPRIEKINLTTGPMAITGSTRMQATSIQLCVLLTVLEMVVRELLGAPASRRRVVEKNQSQHAGGTPALPELFLAKLEELHATLKSPELLASLAKLVALEESIYRANRKVNYFADRLGIDVLTDTTERSPTYCTPPFRKFDDTTATESWAFLFLPQLNSADAWRSILKREPRCVEWPEAEVRALVDEEKVPRTLETIRKISCTELMRFRIGQDGMSVRPPGRGDSAIAVLCAGETAGFDAAGTFPQAQLEAAREAGAQTGLIYFASENMGRDSARADVVSALRAESIEPQARHYNVDRLAGVLAPPDEVVFVPVPESDFLLDGVTRVAAKLVMNALSTCTMVRLGRVMGNYMIWVVPSNLKLIDRATRYITRLAELPYDDANRLLFEVIEYVEPRMKSDQAYPPVVGMAVLRAKHKLTNEQAEQQLLSK